jgi:HEAT repeat protein
MDYLRINYSSKGNQAMQEGKIPDFRFQIRDFKFRYSCVLLLVALLFVGAVRSHGQTIPPAGSEDKLIAVLKSDAPHKEKADACRQLAIIGTKAAVAPLAALLGDEKLSHMARYGLEPIPDPAVDEALRDALGKLKGLPLVGVIGSIGMRRDATAVPALGKLLRDPDTEVAQAAARSLGNIGNSAAAKALQGALPDSPGANQLALCEGLFRCAEALAESGQRAEAIAIYDRLRNSDAPRQVRAGALRGAILARQKKGLRLLRQLLRSDDYVLFSAAVQTAQEMPGAEVTLALNAELDRLPTDNQILLIQTLGKRADMAALPALFTATKSDAKSVRLAAIRALPEIGHASAVPRLVELLDDADRQVSQTAQESLAALPGQDADAAVMRMLDSSKASEQLTAIDLIGRRRIADSIAMLLQVGRGGDPQVRPAAIKMVGELGGANQLAGLLDLLMDAKESGDLDAAEQALKAVCTKTDEPQVHTKKLTGLLGKAQGPQKSALLRVLGVIGGPEALQAVREAAAGPDEQARSAAVRILCAWSTPDAAPDLLAMAKAGPDAPAKTAALQGYIRLIRHDSLSTEQKLSMCKEAAGLVQRDEEKKLLLGVLGTVPAGEALSMAMAYLDNAATKDEACFAAVAIGEKIVRQGSGQVADAMRLVLKASDNRDVTRRAKQVLNKAK